MKLSKYIGALLAITILGLGTDCRDLGTQGPQEENRVTLTLIDVGVREVYLHVKVQGGATDERVVLLHNGLPGLTFGASIHDTTITDTGLTQGSLYVYEATLQKAGETTSRSNQVAVQTLFPSSESFTWQTYILGDGNNNWIGDAGILSADPLVAYVGGEIYKNQDGTAQIDPVPYNFGEWNGISWALQRVNVTFRGNVITPPVFGIFPRAQNDIWLAAGLAIHGDGTYWTGHDVRMLVGYDTLSLSKCWGDQLGMYFVGLHGSLALYDGSRWQRLSSGTTTDINDVWGAINPVTGKEEVYCAVTSFITTGDRKILKITDHTTVDSLQWDSQLAVSSVWTNHGYPLYACGDGLFVNNGAGWRQVSPGINDYMNAVRGTGVNDIFVVGVNGHIMHWNGLSWQMLHSLPAGGYAAMTVKGNLVIAVGDDNQGHGLITIGKREP